MCGCVMGVSHCSADSDGDVPPSLWSLLNDINGFQNTDEMFDIILMAGRDGVL